MQANRYETGRWLIMQQFLLNFFMRKRKKICEIKIVQKFKGNSFLVDLRSIRKFFPYQVDKSSVGTFVNSTRKEFPLKGMEFSIPWWQANFSLFLREWFFYCFKYQGRFVEIFLYNMKMLIPVSREIGMGKIPHSSLMAHSHIPHSRLSSRSEK